MDCYFVLFLNKKKYFSYKNCTDWMLGYTSLCYSYLTKFQDFRSKSRLQVLKHKFLSQTSVIWKKSIVCQNGQETGLFEQGPVFSLIGCYFKCINSNYMPILDVDSNFTVNIKKKMWYGCQIRQLSTQDQMTQKLTTIDYNKAFKDEKSPRRDKCKTI